MRKFSVKEKNMITVLVKQTSISHTYLPINLFNDIIHGQDVGIDGSLHLLVFHIAKGLKPDHDRMILIYKDILERILLLQYLQKEGLVHIIPMATSTNYQNVINCKPTGREVTMSIGQETSDILLNYANYPIYVGETLRDHVNNGFVSFEEKSLAESKKQTFYSFLAVVLAIISVLLGLIKDCCSSNHDGDTNSVVYDNDSTSVNIPVGVGMMINYMQNNIEGKLDATVKGTADIHAKLCDTLNVNITNCKHHKIPPKRIPKPNLNPCVVNMKIDTCRDTVVSKASLMNDTIVSIR